MTGTSSAITIKQKQHTLAIADSMKTHVIKILAVQFGDLQHLRTEV